MGSLTQTMSGKRTAVFPASFDPVTNGHLDIIRRALALNIFDEIVLAVGVNPAKRSLFSLEERVALLKEAVAGWDGQERIRVLAMEGLTADFARGVQASAILRGIRSPLDFEYEAQMYFLNRRLAPEIDTIFLLADPKYAFLSSALVKQVAQIGGSLDGLAPPQVVEKLRARLQENPIHANAHDAE